VRCEGSQEGDASGSGTARTRARAGGRVGGRPWKRVSERECVCMVRGCVGRRGVDAEGTLAKAWSGSTVQVSQ
jgi:hypothetical protein